MNSREISRKHFIRKTAIIGAGIGFVATNESFFSSCSNAPSGVEDRGLVFSNLEEADMEIEKIRRAKKIVPYGVWNAPQILLHCAQSIYFSIQGYPENKSVAFRNTIGKFAFWNFERKGRMSHDLDAPIPGAPALATAISLEESVTELRKSFEAFGNHNKEFAPHFAYGNLTKSEYEQAHAMHIANHLSYVTYS